jgi:hypothetical protein
MHIPFKTLLISVLPCSCRTLLCTLKIQRIRMPGACSNNHQLKTIGDGAGNIGLVWNSKTYEMKRGSFIARQPALYKNQDTGLDLVVLGNKAMLFNIRSGVRLADFCQTADMKTGKEPHLFAKE